jgi:D-3-phosphoglycerate dehydrogenase
VRVIQAGTATVRSNAEYQLACLMSLYRRGIGDALAGQRHAPVRLGRELHGSTVGLFGLAPSGQALALMLSSLGVKLIGYDPAVHQSAAVWERLKVRPVSLPELLAQADAVTVQVLYAPRYRCFVNDRVLQHCRPGQLWVSTTRSDFFDPQALASALMDGRIETALIDSAEAGFASRGTPLHDLSNLVITPRLGSHTREARIRASWYVVHRLHEALTRAETTAMEPPSTGMMALEDLPGADTPFIIR